MTKPLTVICPLWESELLLLAIAYAGGALSEAQSRHAVYLVDTHAREVTVLKDYAKDNPTR